MGKFPNDARSQAIMVWQERGRRAEPELCMALREASRAQLSMVAPLHQHSMLGASLFLPLFHGIVLPGTLRHSWAYSQLCRSTAQCFFCGHWHREGAIWATTDFQEMQGNAMLGTCTLEAGSIPCSRVGVSGSFSEAEGLPTMEEEFCTPCTIATFSVSEQGSLSLPPC